MNPNFRNLMAGLVTAAALLLSACGGGGGGDAPVTPPTAVAKASQTSVAIGTAVTLDGGSSTTPNGSALSYQWTLSTKPDGSTAALSSATDAKPSFTPDKPGNYVADLVVNDGKAGSAAVRVTVAATNPDPVAVVAQASQGVLLGATVTLDGSGSLPPTGLAASELSYRWTLTQQPEGGTASIASATSAKASLLAQQVGIYRATLVVRHGERSSVAVETVVTVNTANSAPVVKLSVPTTVVRGSTVVLDGSASSDPDGGTLGYRWSVPSFIANSTFPPIPYASQTTIRNATSAKAEFVADVAGRYHVDFTVYDGSVATTQRTIVTVTKPVGAANSAPVAVINGPAGGDTLEYEMGAWATPGGGLSYDVDGDTLTYKWTWWNTATSDQKQTGTGSVGVNSRTLAAGSYQVELVVNDGTVDSATATKTFTIKTGANMPPVAKVKVDVAKVLVGQAILFNGSGSTDANGDALGYQWTLLDRPNGSAAVLQGATSSSASVVADQPGVYTAQLRVTDSKGAISARLADNTISAFAKIRNNAPVVGLYSLWGGAGGSFGLVNYTSDTLPGQPLILGASGTSLTGAAAFFDPDNDVPLYYLLTVTKQPFGSAVSSTSGYIPYVATGGQAIAGVNSGPLTVPGEYEFEVMVSDGVSNSEPKRLSLTAIGDRVNYPTLLLEAGNLLAIDVWYQRFFPAAQLGGEFVTADAGDALVVGKYRLTAFDRDYTITGLKTSSTDSTRTPAFVGLVDGQVIPKGQSVTFTLTRPRIPDEVNLVLALNQLGFDKPNSDEYKAEGARLRKLIDDLAFTWSFGVAEKTGYTFYRGPANQ